MVKIDTILIHANKASQVASLKVDVTEPFLTEHGAHLRYKLVSDHPTSFVDKCLFKSYLWITNYCNILFIFILVAILLMINNYNLCEIDVSNQLKKHTSEVNTPRTLPIKAMHFEKEHCSQMKEGNRLECIQQKEILDEEQCLSAGCCWLLTKTDSPKCFYPVGYKTYTITNLSTTKVGMSASIQSVSGFNSTFPGDVSNLKVDINFRTKDVLQIKVGNDLIMW